METLKRWWSNIKWLLNHPSKWTAGAPEGCKCDYCGATVALWNIRGVYTACHFCMKEAFDKVLCPAPVKRKTIAKKKKKAK